jgi:hypothetical protein
VNHRFNFEKYVQIHKDQHTALNGIEEFGFPRLDDWTKVHHLLNGMRTDSLDAAKGQIWASHTLRANFEACVDLFKTFLSQQTANSTNAMNVSDLSTDYQGRKWHGGRGIAMNNNGIDATQEEAVDVVTEVASMATHTDEEEEVVVEAAMMDEVVCHHKKLE